ncbi:MAG: hypothetical protein L6R35_007499 [Caloplaca aegaea]|nr:MAG: hypothetical protein L6R35_007499 [Caloplaca aegaea]
MTMTIHQPSKPPSEKDFPSILCLHGGGTSASIFAIQTGRLRRALASHFRFVFVDAPFFCPPGPGVLPFFQGMGPYRRWISDAGGDEEGRVLPLLRKTMAEDGGDFVGLLGFSQGARLAMGLLRDQQQQQQQQKGRADVLGEFEFGVLLCGTYPPLSLSSGLLLLPGGATPRTAQFETLHFDEEDEGVVGIPTVHVVGDRDPYVPKSRLLVRCSKRESRTVMEFDIRHNLPVKPADTQRLADRMVRLHRDQVEVQQQQQQQKKKKAKSMGKGGAKVEVRDVEVEA